MRILVAPACAGVVFLCSCHGAKIPMTQLQVRQIQTRHYEIKKPKLAIKAILNVLQDEGFIPKQANSDVGFVYAVKEMDIEDDRTRFWATFWHGRKNARWTKNSVIECAANVTELSYGMRVRLSFQVKVFDNNGKVLGVETIRNPQFYQDFFSRVDKGVFLEKEGV